MRYVRRVYNVIRELAVITAFIVLVVMPLTKKMGAQEKHSIYSSVRPNDSTKTNPAWPWVATFDPPAIYEQWWKEISACERIPHPGQLTRAIRWVEVNGTSFHIGMRMQKIYGFTDPERLTIYIAEGSILDPEIVKHEMVHQIHWWMGMDEGEDFHPPDSFWETCGLHQFHP